MVWIEQFALACGTSLAALSSRHRGSRSWWSAGPSSRVAQQGRRALDDRDAARAAVGRGGRADCRRRRHGAHRRRAPSVADDTPPGVAGGAAVAGRCQRWIVGHGARPPREPISSSGRRSRGVWPWPPADSISAARSPRSNSRRDWRRSCLLRAPAGAGAGDRWARGRVGLTWRASGSTTALHQAAFEVQGRLESGRFEHPALPFPVGDVSATFTADRAGIAVQSLQGHSGSTLLRFRPTAGLDGSRRLRDPSSRRSGWSWPGTGRTSCPRRRPANGQTASRRRGGCAGPGRPGGRHDRSAGVGPLPQRVDHALPLSLPARSRGNGRARRPVRSRCISPARRAAIRCRSPAGSTSPWAARWGTWRLRRATACGSTTRSRRDAAQEALTSSARCGPPARSTSSFATTVAQRCREATPIAGHSPAQCSMAYAGFPYPLTNVSGRIRMDRGHWTFHDLVGRRTIRASCGAPARSCPGPTVMAS